MAANIITKFVLGQFAKKSARKTGVAQLLKANDPIVQSNVRNITIKLQNMGIDPKNLTSTDDVLNAMNYHKAMMDQHLKQMDQHLKQQFKGFDLDKGIKSLEKEKYDDVTKKMWKEKKKSTIVKDKTLFKDSPEAIAKIKAENKAAAERLRKKKEAEELFTDERPPKDPDFASGGIARVGMLMGGFTKAEVLIQMLKNTIKGSKDPYVKKTFPKWIKEIQANPSLANNENVWKNLTTGLPKNQRLVVHSDDTVDFWTQSEFGPHNIETTTKFHKKHPYLTRDQAVKIQNMEPEDQILEMKRLETIRNRTKNATGGRVSLSAGGLAGMLGE